MIDALSDDARAQMEALIAKWRQAQPTYRVIAVIDAAFQHHTLLPWLERHVMPAHYMTLYASLPNADRATCQVSPQLVDLTAMDVDARQALLMQTSGQPMFSMIHTPESIALLGERLAPFRIITMNETPYVLRLFDTRRLPHMLAMLTDLQRQMLVGPAQAWWYVTRSGEWQSMTLSKTPTQACAEGRVVLEGDQVQVLMSMHEIDAIAEMMESLVPELFNLWEKPSARFEWLECERRRMADEPVSRAMFVRHCEQRAIEQGWL